MKYWKGGPGSSSISTEHLDPQTAFIFLRDPATSYCWYWKTVSHANDSALKEAIQEFQKFQPTLKSLEIQGLGSEDAARAWTTTLSTISSMGSVFRAKPWTLKNGYFEIRIQGSKNLILVERETSTTVGKTTSAPISVVEVAPRSVDNEKLRVLIVDDSSTLRALLSRLLSADPEIEVVGAIADPCQVMEAIPKLRPHVITLDLHMPEMDGVTLLKKYMPIYPIPTVLISAITPEEGPEVLNGLEAGAVDYIEKPRADQLAQSAQEIRDRVKAAKNARIQNTSRTKGVRKPAAPVQSPGAGGYDPTAVVLIGSSTGGTEALKDLFLSMPKEVPPILVVQHIPPIFSKALADRLNHLCPFSVKEAEDRDEIVPNRVLIAPGGFQMGIENKAGRFCVRILDAPPVNRHLPSVDYLYDSALPHFSEYRFIASILTGMGADGALAMVRLREKGARTFAQNEETCVVFGMPREALRMGGAEKAVPLPDMAHAILSAAQRQTRRMRSA